MQVYQLLFRNGGKSGVECSTGTAEGGVRPNLNADHMDNMIHDHTTHNICYREQPPR